MTERIIIGLIFWMVIRIQAVGQRRLFNMLGYQQKAGGPPAFISTASWKIMSDHWLIGVIDSLALTMISPEATA